MSASIRTKNCKCGSIEFKLDPKVGEIDYICAKCNGHVATIKYDDYETVNKECKCGSNIFKVKISEDHDKVRWATYCSKCSEKPKRHYIDDDGNEIDRGTRELLIIRHSIDDLMCRIETLESDFNSLDSTVRNIENETSSYDYDINHVKNRINSCERSISDLGQKVDRLE